MLQHISFFNLILRDRKTNDKLKINIKYCVCRNKVTFTDDMRLSWHFDQTKFKPCICYGKS